MQFLRFTICCVLLCSSASSLAFIKPIVKVVAVEDVGYTNRDGTGLYWEIVDTVFDEKYQVIKITAPWSKAKRMVENGTADAIISVTELENSRFILSKHHIDYSYPLYALYKDRNIFIETLNDLANYKLAIQRQSGINKVIPESANVYQVESLFNIDNLVLNNKVDIALAYSYDLHLASPKNRLIAQEIAPEKSLYMAFTNSNIGENWRDIFDNAMEKAIKDKSIEALFPNKIDYLQANFQSTETNTAINWNLVPKIYNQKTKRLDVLERELTFSQFIANTLPEYSFHFTEKTVSIDELLLTDENTNCAFTIPKQTINLVMSKPAHVFIKPRLFVFKQPKNAMLQQALKQGNSVNLAQLLAADKSFTLAVSRNSNIHKDLLKEFDKSLMKRFYLVEDLNYKHLVDLMLSKRIDAVIAWPSMIAELIEDKSLLTQFSSFDLTQPIGKNLFSHIICSSTPTGYELVDKINLLLNSPIYQPALHKTSIEQLDEQSRQQFKQLLDLSF